ncbi:MAG: sulfite exporter TauE/SafE family protein [Melioribacteraceae bacterium]|nr:sulfite exporter TauE/SafE family protein [Melioribacteraceae bacterium]
MDGLLEILLLFGVGIITSFINVMAGGGSTITLPVLIFLGLDSSVANGTNRIGLLSQNLFGILSFRKENVSQLRLSLKLSMFTLPGAIIGAFYATKIDDALFQKILGVVMIGIVFTMLIPNSKNFIKEKISTKLPWAIYPAMFALGFYGGFIQVGIGFLLMLSLHHILHLSLLYVNLHKVFIVMIYTIPALIVFIITDNVNWLFGLSLASGTAVGAWWSAKLAVKKGEKVIKGVLIVAILIMSYKLFFNI